MKPMPEHTLATPLAYALAYAKCGWHVLPIEPKAKVPLGRLVPRGLHDASTDAETIRKWWTASPEANVGIALAPSGLVAIDVDPRNGGTESFEQLQAAHGSLRSDVMAFTGGGGEHHVFLVPPGAQISLPGSLGPGIDLKANGYIVAEPSIHPSGKQYGWEASSSPLDGVVPSPLPDWLRSLRVTLQMPAMRPGEVPVDAQQASDAREALYCLNADSYEDWLHAGMALHSTRWGHPAYAMWCSWSQQSDKFDATACRKKWQSFTSDQERGDIGLSLAWVFGQAQARGWRNPRAALHRVEEPITGEYKLVRANVNFTQLRPTKWVLEGFVAAGEVVVWAGQPGVGKSTVFAALALVVAGLGVAIHSDIANDRPRRVLIVSEHVGQYERLFFGFCHEFGLNPDMVAEQIVLFDAVRMSAREIGGEITHILGGPDVDPPLVVLDTASASFDLLDENSNAEVAMMMAAIKKPVAATGAPLWVAGHAAKALGREDSEITPRGASAYIGDAHGTGSVFRDKNIPDSVFLKSLKNRSAREFSEIEVKTKLVAHMVTDERGITKQELIRIGVPVISKEGDRARIADASKEAQAEAAQMAADMLLTDAIKRAVAEGAYPTRRSVCAAGIGRSTRVLERIQEMLLDGVLVERPYPPGVKTHHRQKAFLAVSFVSHQDADMAQKEYRNAL